MDPLPILALAAILGALWLGELHGLGTRREAPRTITQMPPDFTERERQRLRRILDTAIVIRETAHA